MIHHLTLPITLVSFVCKSSQSKSGRILVRTGSLLLSLRLPYWEVMNDTIWPILGLTFFPWAVISSSFGLKYY